MKKLLFLFLALSSHCTLFAQLRLDVEGDAKILGRLDLNFGSQNVFIGTNAGMNTTTQSSNNTFIGSTAGNNNQGDDNTFIGKNAGVLNFEGNENTYIGINAGKGLTGNTRNVMLGSNATADDDLDKAIAIGYNAKVECTNCAVIGGTGVDEVNVGISTATPQTKLHIEGGIDASLSKHGYLVNGPINGTNLVIDNNEIMARNNGETSELYLNANGGNVGVNVATPPTAKLHVKGSVRFQDLPTASDGFLVGIDASGNLFRNVLPSANSLLENKSAIMLEEQTELIKTKSREISDLKIENDSQNEIIEDLQIQVNELKSLVEKLLIERREIPKNTSLTLSLEQKALLNQNQPNPFRENTLVNYFVPADVQNAHIQVTGVDGKVLGQVTINEMGKGQVTIQSKSYPAGTYFYSLVLDGQVMETKRMVLAR